MTTDSLRNGTSFWALVSNSARADFAGRHDLASIAVIALFTLADLAWAPFSPVHVDPISLLQMALMLSLLGAIYLLGPFAIHRARGDSRPVAKLVSWSGSYLSLLASNSIVFAALGFVGCVFMYFASATERPLMDTYLAAVDTKLGRNSLHFVKWVNGYPMLDRAHGRGLSRARFTGPISVPALRNSGKNTPPKLVALIAVASLMTGVLMAAIPAWDAYAFFDPPRSLFSNFTGVGGILQLDTLRQLRSGSAFELNVFHVIGIASFPSFHAALGLVILYSLRHDPFLLAVLGTINTMMLVATIPEGGHHLIDVIAGAAVAAVSIIFIRCVARAPASNYTPANERAPQAM